QCGKSSFTQRTIRSMLSGCFRATHAPTLFGTKRSNTRRSNGLILGPMSLNSQIEWTDATWNPVRGCTKISPGCKHCYAETFAERFRGVKGHPYEQGFD